MNLNLKITTVRRGVEPVRKDHKDIYRPNKWFMECEKMVIEKI